MDNYQRALLYAQTLFLKWDQERMIALCRLRHDESYLYLNFLGDPWRIDRASGAASCLSGTEANFSQGLSIYDYICRESPLPCPSSRLCAVNSLPHLAQSNPNAGSLHQKHADFFQDHIPALKLALEKIGTAAFPQGDAACIFPVFDGFNAVFQFWEGDEDFPPAVRFLWPENSQDFLKYETLYYVMGCFMEKLKNRIEEIEKNS